MNLPNSLLISILHSSQCERVQRTNTETQRKWNSRQRNSQPLQYMYDKTFSYRQSPRMLHSLMPPFSQTTSPDLVSFRFTYCQLPFRTVLLLPFILICLPLLYFFRPEDFLPCYLIFQRTYLLFHQYKMQVHSIERQPDTHSGKRRPRTPTHLVSRG